MDATSGPNPMAAIFRLIQSNQAVRDELWNDPRGLISRVATEFPEEVKVQVFRDDSGQAYLQSSIALAPEDFQRSMRRMRRCPVAQISADELVADPSAALAPYGLRVPEDIVVTSDGEYLHFRVSLKEAAS